MSLAHHWNLISLLAVSFIALVTIGPSSAAQCRKLDKVQDSMKSLDRNVELGGHVWIHVYGEKNRPSTEKPEVDKTMFRNVGELYQAWNAWKDSPDTKGAKCGSTAKGDRECVSVGKLGGVTQLYKCTKVENNVCTAHSEARDVAAARFDYAFKKVGTKSQWILNTAYPSEYSDCR